MKILYAIQGVERSSGVSLFVIEMLKQLLARGHECTLLYSTCFEVADLIPVGVRVVRSNDVASVLNDGDYDLVHMHGLWSMFNRRVMATAHAQSIPYIVSPHGCLMPSAMRKGFLKKILFYFLLLRPYLNHAAYIHVTTVLEQTACQGLWVRGRFVIAPLGLNVEPLLNSAKEKIVLTLSRISPEKGIADLLTAWNKISHQRWRLIVAGPSWRGHREELEKKVAAESISDVEFSGPVYGEEKRRLYARASLFVMPSYTENFGGTVLEALAENTPVLTTTDVDWELLKKEGCGWWISRAELSHSLSQVMALTDAARLEMGKRGRRLVESCYTWDRVADKIEKKYLADSNISLYD